MVLGKLLKWLVRSALTSITLVLAAMIYLLVAVDPNDYKPQIKNLAANQGLQLSMDGDLAWQFFPQIGIKIEQVGFAYTNSSVNSASGDIGQLTLAVNWSELLKLLNTSRDAKQLPMGAIKISDSSIRIQSTDADALPIELDSINAVIRNLSIGGENFPLSFSAVAVGGLDLSLSADMALNFIGNRLQKLSLENALITIDQLQMEGNLLTEDGFITAEGNLQGNKLNIKEQINRLGKTFSALQLPAVQLPAMASENALTAVSFDSSFSFNSNAMSTITTNLTIDDQRLIMDTQINHPTNNLYLGISGDNFNIANYMAVNTVSTAQSGQTAQSQTQNNSLSAPLLAPILAPLALWDGRSQLELSLGALDFADFVVGNIYLNLFGNEKVLRLSSLNADLFNGQVNATGRLDMRSTTAVFELQNSLTNIDLQLALPALADSRDISGLLNLNTSLQGAGNSREEILNALSGSGELTIADPSYLTINAEEMFCNAAALFGGGNIKKSWTKGTVLENLSSQFTVANGKVMVNDLKTATGNLSINGRGTVQLLLKRYSITANTRVNGTTTSPSGCSVNKNLRNRNLPFICTGSYDVGGKTSCRPDDSLVKGLLRDNVFQKLGEQLFDSPLSGGDNNKNQGQEEDPIKGLLRGVLEKNLK